MPSYNALHNNMTMHRGINQVNHGNKLDQSKTTSKSISIKLFYKKKPKKHFSNLRTIFMSMTFYSLTLKSMKSSSPSPA